MSPSLLYYFRLLCAAALLLLLSPCASLSSGELLSDNLVHFEFIHKHDLRHRVVPEKDEDDRQKYPTVAVKSFSLIHFYALNRSFGLHLSPHQSLFSSSFKAVAIESTGDHRPVPVDTGNYHRGHLIGDKSSLVTAHVSEDGILTAHIETNNETYYIEPAKLHTERSHDDHMIVYKLSDVKRNGNLTIDYETVPPYSHVLIESSEGLAHRIRKRQSKSVDRNTCTLALVVDYRFYTFLLSSENAVITTLVSRVSRVDSGSFRPTQWVINANGNTLTNQGLQIGTIIIHTGPSSDSSHYNSQESGQIESQDLLRRFSRGDWSRYCLAHLFTHRQFSSGKLGLAYIASPETGETGGICSGRVIDSHTNDVVIYNTGLSVASTGKRLLLPHESELVIAHEIGHSWGSQHDPGNDPNCRLKYLMNEFIQDDSQDTHKKFSLCSRISVGRVLVNKAGCFQVLSDSKCGNYVIDAGEECDGGRLTVDDKDKCCNSKCLLRKESNCSDINHSCCQNCMIAPENSRVCHYVGSISNDCTRQTYCNGSSYVCPPPLPAPVGTDCLNGKCLYADSTNTTIQCVPLCTIAGYTSCKCQGSQRCLECCLNTTGDETCQPLLDSNGGVTFFPNGVFCDKGICTDGECIDQIKDFASQLWSVIRDLNINQLALFLKENIVGCVLLISLLVWIPGGCIFHWLCDVKKIWKKCLRRSHDKTDGRTRQAFETQTSWAPYKRNDPRVDLTPLLSVEDDSNVDVLGSHFFEPVDEPVDDTPLPSGYHDYGGSRTPPISSQKPQPSFTI